MAENIKYVAELSDVREVSLLGSAELGYWNAYLEPFGLEPTVAEGKAQILIIAAGLRFMGVPFQEVSFSVLVNSVGDKKGETGDRHSATLAWRGSDGHLNGSNGSYLLHAFNSVRFFAFSERVFFSTPYTYGQCEVVTRVPLKIQVSLSGKRTFLAHMSSSTSERVPISSGEDGWHGPVFVPTPPQKSQKYFIAKISGQTTTFAFEPSHDKIVFGNASTNQSIFKSLIDSGFEGKLWHLRPNAYHGKSQTYQL